MPWLHIPCRSNPSILIEQCRLTLIKAFNINATATGTPSFPKPVRYLPLDKCFGFIHFYFYDLKPTLNSEKEYDGMQQM